MGLSVEDHFTEIQSLWRSEEQEKILERFGKQKARH
jgi:hypothetical protein